MLEAKAIWEHTCIAGGLLVFFVSFFGSTKNSTSKTGPCPNNEKMEGHPVSRISLHLTCISLQKPLKTLISELFKGFNLHLIQEIISPSELQLLLQSLRSSSQDLHLFRNERIS